MFDATQETNWCLRRLGDNCLPFLQVHMGPSHLLNLQEERWLKNSVYKQLGFVQRYDPEPEHIFTDNLLKLRSKVCSPDPVRASVAHRFRFRATVDANNQQMFSSPAVY